MKCESVTFEFWMPGGLTLSPTFQARISVKKSILFHHDSITNTQQLGGYGHSKLSYRIHEIQQVVLIVAGRSSVLLTHALVHLWPAMSIFFSIRSAIFIYLLYLNIL